MNASVGKKAKTIPITMATATSAPCNLMKGRDFLIVFFSAQTSSCTNIIEIVPTTAITTISSTVDPRLLHIQVRSEGMGVLSGARSRAEFTTFRACTNTAGGCPEAP